MMFGEGLEKNVTKMLLKKLLCAERLIVCEIRQNLNGFCCSWFQRYDKGEKGLDSRMAPLSGNNLQVGIY